MAKSEPSYNAGRNVKWGRLHGNILMVSHEANTELLYKQELQLLGIYPEDLKLGAENRYSCRNVHCSITHKRWKHTRVHQQINE